MSKKVYGKLFYNVLNNRWVVTDLPPHIRIRFKNLFPKVNKFEMYNLELPNTDDTCSDLCWFMQRYPLEISDEDLKKLKLGKKNFEDLQEEIDTLLLPDYIAPTYIGLKENQKVRDYQAQAVELLYKTGKLLLLDTVGLGKTYTGIASALKLKQRTIVIVETHLPKQWLKKIKEFSTLTTHFVKSRKPYKLPEADIYVMKYSSMQGWADLFETGMFKVVIYDEIQNLRTGLNSEKGKAAEKLSDNADYILGLSATPIFNWGVEIFEILRFVNKDILGSKEEFLREWCDYDGRLKDPEALGAYLRESHVTLRRTRKDVGHETKGHSTAIEWIDVDEKDVKEDVELTKQLAIKTLTGTFVEKGAAARQFDIQMRRNTGVAKARGVARYVKMLVENGEKIVLSGWHRDVYDIFLEELKAFNPVMYTGSETPSQKDKSVQKFKEGESSVFIISNRSGAGLDELQFYASLIVIGELDWSNKIHEQLIGRLDREGQTEHVHAIFCVCNYGSDPIIMDIIGLKESESNAIVDPYGKEIEEESNESELAELDKNRLKIAAKMYLEKHGVDISKIENIENV